MSKEAILIILIPSIFYAFYMVSIFENITCFSNRTSDIQKNIFIGNSFSLIALPFFILGIVLSYLTKKYFIIYFIFISVIYILTLLILKHFGLTKKRYKSNSNEKPFSPRSRKDKIDMIQNSFDKAAKILKENDTNRKN